ncbi:MAG: alpha/beta fold hydrolase [Hyphomonadaceae bacterium]
MASPARGVTDEGIIDLPGLASRWVRLENGAKAHYITSGDKGPAVLLLHGGIEGSSGTAGFRFMAPFLGANGFRVYAPDRPGYGLSDTSHPDYLRADAKANVDFVKMFADALCLDKFHLSGNSAGCMVSANFVVSHPERVLSVAFIAGGLGDVSPKPRVMGPEGKFTPNPSYTMPAWDGTAQGMYDLMAGIIYAQSAIWPEVIEMRVKAALAQREARGGKFSALTPATDPNLVQIFSTKGRIDKLTIPMIYLFGLQDVLAPVENGFNQEDSVPNIQFFYPDECGHQGQTDQPEIFNQTFLEFFRDGKVSWPTAVRAGVSLRRAINPKFVAEPAGGFPKPTPEIYAGTEALRKGLAGIKQMAK